MPSWRFIPLSDRKALVRHLLSFHKEWEFRSAEPPIPLHENPFDLSTDEGAAKAAAVGLEVYHKQATCWNCHPSYLAKQELEKLSGVAARDDLENAIGKPDLWGETILPPDFRRSTLKSVRDLRDLYRVIAAGVGGTAMPSWKGALTAEQLWGLTVFVDSLRPDSFVRRSLERAARKETP